MSGIWMPQRNPAFIGFVPTLLPLDPFSLLSLFLSLSYAIYLTITLSAYLIEPTNAFFLLLLAITALFCLSSFSLFAREDAYCQFRERTVNRDEH